MRTVRFSPTSRYILSMNENKQAKGVTVWTVCDTWERKDVVGFARESDAIAVARSLNEGSEVPATAAVVAGGNPRGTRGPRHQVEKDYSRADHAAS